MINFYAKYKIAILLVLILFVATFFRFYNLTQAPPGLYPDEATNGVNALEALNNKNWKVFYPENNGREGLFINIQSLSLKIFGAQPWALRGVSGVFGVLTILGLFLLTQLLWNNRLALLASYLMAISFWPVNFSRLGFRAIMLPFILVWAFYFLWRGLLLKKYWLILIGGLIYGLGFHTYISWRASPLIIVLFFSFLLLKRRSTKNQSFHLEALLPSMGIFILGAIISASPLLWYYLHNQADFMGRAAQVSIFNSNSPIKSLAISIAKTLGMFNIAGDFNWRHNLAGRPELFWPVGLGFLIGLIGAFKNLKNTNYKLLITNYFLIIWFFIMLLPNFLAPEGAPHALRALGALPAVFIFSALGLDFIYQKTQRYFNRALLKTENEKRFDQIRRIKKEIYLLAIVFLIMVGLWEARTYFVVWARKTEVRQEFSERLVDISDYLKKLKPETKKFVIINEGGALVKNIPIQAQPIIFLNFNRQKEINFIRPDDIAFLPADLTNAVIIPTLIDNQLFDALLTKYPHGHMIDLYTFKIFKTQTLNPNF